MGKSASSRHPSAKINGECKVHEALVKCPGAPPRYAQELLKQELTPSFYATLRMLSRVITHYHAYACDDNNAFERDAFRFYHIVR